MIYLFFVAAPARSGTKWYSDLFTTDRSYCFHELGNLIHPEPTNQVLDEWLRAQAADHDFEHLQRRSMLQLYPDYFLRHWEQSRISGQFMIGNSDCHMPLYLPGIWLLWPTTRFLFSFRNGINVVESQKLANFTAIERNLYPDLGQFEGLCQAWARSIGTFTQIKTWLTDHKANVLETRLEQMTSDPAELERIWEQIVGNWPSYRERCISLQSTPLNTRTNRERVVSWQEIWDQWSVAERAAFSTICGTVQQQLGYELPDVENVGP
ncbi:MAG: sulfotransferase [Candidatus Dormibacteraceae bacterium]